VASSKLAGGIENPTLQFENIGKNLVKKSTKFLFRIKNNWNRFFKNQFNMRIEEIIQ